MHFVDALTHVFLKVGPIIAMTDFPSLRKFLLPSFLAVGALTLPMQKAVAQDNKKPDPYTQGARVEKADPYTDGAKSAKFDTYTDGARSSAGSHLVDDKADAYMQGEKIGARDPYTDGAKPGKPDPYTDGSRKRQR